MLTTREPADVQAAHSRAYVVRKMVTQAAPQETNKQSTTSHNSLNVQATRSTREHLARKQLKFKQHTKLQANNCNSHCSLSVRPAARQTLEVRAARTSCKQLARIIGSSSSSTYQKCLQEVLGKGTLVVRHLLTSTDNVQRLYVCIRN